MLAIEGRTNGGDQWDWGNEKWDIDERLKICCCGNCRNEMMLKCEVRDFV